MFEFKGLCCSDCFNCKYFDEKPPDGYFFGYCKAYKDGFICFTNIEEGKCPKREV